MMIKHRFLLTALAISMTLALSACSLDGDDGEQGLQGPQGEQGPAGPSGNDGANGQSAFTSLSLEVVGRFLKVECF